MLRTPHMQNLTGAVRQYGDTGQHGYPTTLLVAACLRGSAAFFFVAFGATPGLLVARQAWWDCALVANGRDLLACHAHPGLVHS